MNTGLIDCLGRPHDATCLYWTFVILQRQTTNPSLEMETNLTDQSSWQLYNFTADFLIQLILFNDKSIASACYDDCVTKASPSHSLVVYKKFCEIISVINVVSNIFDEVKIAMTQTFLEGFKTRCYQFIRALPGGYGKG